MGSKVQEFKKKKKSRILSKDSEKNCMRCQDGVSIQETGSKGEYHEGLLSPSWMLCNFVSSTLLVGFMSYTGHGHCLGNMASRTPETPFTHLPA